MTAEEPDSDDPAHDFHPIWVRPYITSGKDEPSGDPTSGSPGTMSTGAEPGLWQTGPLVFSGPEHGDRRTLAAGPADAGPSTEIVLLEGRGRIPGRRRLSPLALTAGAVATVVAAVVVVVVVSVVMALQGVGQKSHGQDNDYVLQPKDIEGDATARPSHSGKASPSGSPSAQSSASGGPGPSGSSDGTAGPSGKPGGPAKTTGSPAPGVSTPGSSGAQTPAGGGTLAVGETRSFQSVGSSGAYLVARDDGFAYVDQVSGSGSEATFTVVAGLADADCYSFVASNGDYLRHRNFRARVATSDGSTLFEQDATFCPRPGSKSGSVSLEAYNYPGDFLRARGTELWLDPHEDSADYAAESSFFVTQPPG
jgi:hypothetical protein